MKVNVEEREKLGKELFKSGYGCAQSVAAAFADVYGIDRDLMLRIASSFGGGFGRMRLTCGTVSGMGMLAGLENGSVEARDSAAKGKNYELVQSLAGKFKAKTGSIICAEMLGLKPMAPTPATPEARTPEYYRKRPCVELVGLACRIYAEHLNEMDAANE